MNDIPDWAGKRACELLNAEAHKKGTRPDWNWADDSHRYPAIAVAKLVMQHEQPPVDPDEEAVKRILMKWHDTLSDKILREYHVDFARAVSQYKQEKGNG